MTYHNARLKKTAVAKQPFLLKLSTETEICFQVFKRCRTGSESELKQSPAAAEEGTRISLTRLKKVSKLSAFQNFKYCNILISPFKIYLR
jgi:hypothetical protein